MKPTEGKWETSYEGGVIQVGPAIEPNIAWVTTQEYANLIITAVNACKSVNEQNPLAVAEAIPEIVGILKTLTRAVRKYADIGNKQFNQDEEEFWAMCEENDKAEQALKAIGE